MKRRVAAASLILAIAATAGGFFAQRWQAERNAPPPDPAFTDLEGRPHQLSEYRGKLTLVNFWASWCAPCLNEMPLLVKAQKELGGRGLQILGPALDAPAAVHETVHRFRIDYPVFIGDDQVMQAMEALGDDLGALPFSVLVAPDGRVLERLHGGLSEKRLKALLDRHLPP